eukprot:358287-Chlamydomonas_euryale.AAC.15
MLYRFTSGASPRLLIFVVDANPRSLRFSSAPRGVRTAQNFERGVEYRGAVVFRRRGSSSGPDNRAFGELGPLMSERSGIGQQAHTLHSSIMCSGGAKWARAYACCGNDISARRSRPAIGPGASMRHAAALRRGGVAGTAASRPTARRVTCTAVTTLHP